MKIRVLTTGGTIDKIYFDAKSEYKVGEPQIVELLQEAGVTAEFEVEPVMRVDSLEMTDTDRAAIRERVVAAEESHILISHGTDTLVDTARALSGITGKTIVLFGSMQPASLRFSDAQFNAGFAFSAVQLLPEGVWVAMNGRVFDPAKVVKNRDAHCFEQI